jgi:deoxyribonuclease V
MKMSKTLQKRFLEICSSKDYRAAVAFQNEIAAIIPGRPGREKIDRICGLDISYNRFSPRIYAAAAVYSFPELTVIEEATAVDIIDFPYIPGLLAYREGPPLLRVIRKLKAKVDLFIFDGQGLAHPRGAGIAGTMGLLLDRPSIGAAKTRLIGSFTEPGRTRGSAADLIYNGKVIGKVLRSKSDVKPIFVSVGYKISLASAVKFTLDICVDLKIPVPIRRAHILANMARRRDDC